MWEDILLSVGMSISEALCINQIESKKRKKYSAKINSILAKNLKEYADTSLDCSEFHVYVGGTAFKQHLQGCFYTSNFQSAHIQSYKMSLAQCISEVVKGLKIEELYGFLDGLIRIYDEHLRGIIESDPSIHALFQLLVKANQDALSRIIDEQSKILAYLKAHELSDVVIDNKDIKTYHLICEKEFSTIRFTGIAGAESRQYQSINDFFIESGFSYELNNFSEQYIQLIKTLPELFLKNIFDISNKIVILGGAGLGKTTTLNYIYCNYEELFGPCVLKLKIDLKQYAKDIFEENKDILSCIAGDFYKKTKRKSTSFEETCRLLAEILEKGNCLVILDALDEINSQEARSVVRDQIRVFSELYPLNRIIISSRETGYLRNRFDTSFLHLRINQFGNGQIKQYAYNWYKCNGTGDVRGAWKRFQKEASRARCEKLISNPIILILALIIFDIEKNLPNKRVEFYQKCIDTFLSIREDRRGTQNLCEKAKNILADDCVVPQIAHHKFIGDQADMNYIFTNRELTDAIFEAICVPDPINWKEAVRTYGVYLVERTELIQETDEDVLDFAHKTFYEYFLAVYYAKEYSEEQLKEQLIKWIGDSNLDELARLIIEVVIRNNNSRQHQSIINFLFSNVKKPEDGDKQLSVNILTILSDLYSHNMLLPRFHRQYFMCLLDHAPYVYDADMRQLRNNDEGDRIQYDGTLVADLFLEGEAKDGISYDRIDDLYYLGEEFTKHVLELRPGSNYEQIVMLFDFSHHHRETQDEKTNSVIEYFLYGEGYEYVLRYPQLYLSLVRLLEYSDYEVHKLIACSFGYNLELFRHTSPALLNHMFSSASKKCEVLIILLNVIIVCASENTNYVFSVLLDRCNDRLETNDITNERFILWLWEALNTSIKAEEFIEKLENRGLYDSKYNEILTKRFERYIDKEKNRQKESVQDVIKKIKRRRPSSVAG